ncbi:Protein dyf-7 [Dirofilaria immitis]
MSMLIQICRRNSDKIMIIVRLLLVILVLPFAINSEGFVEEVSCTADAINVVLNKTDPDVQRWMSDPKAQPIVYVYEHKTRPPCGTAMKKGNLVNYNFTIPYGDHCDVHLTDLEPNYRNAETTIALEDNADITLSKTIRVNHVFCLYTRSVQTIRFNDISSGHEVVASTGGKPKPKVEMIFRSIDGRPLRAAKFGDIVEFYVALSPDKAYHGISPKECMFSDREDMSSPDAKHLTFVQSSCPVDEMSEIIDPLANVNEEVYFSKFKTFRFGNQSTVFAHCTVQVCLTTEECAQKCFKRISNSNLTAERLRFRHRRQLENDYYGTTIRKQNAINEIALTRPLTILDDMESNEVNGKKVEQCLINNTIIPLPIFILILSLSMISIVCLIGLIFTLKRLAAYKKLAPYNFGIYGAYSGPTASLPVRQITDSAIHSLSNNGNPATWMDQLSAGIDYPYLLLTITTFHTVIQLTHNMTILIFHFVYTKRTN